MIRDFHDLDQISLRVDAGYPKACLLQLCAVGVVKLVAVAVALENGALAIGRLSPAARRQIALVFAQPHGPAQVFQVLLILHHIDDGMRRARVELCGIGIRPAQDVSGKLDGCNLHPKADAQIGDAVLPGVFGRENLACNAPLAKAAGHQDALRAGQQCRRVLALLQIHRRNPADADVHAPVHPGVSQGFHHAQIRIVQFDVFAHQRDLHLLALKGALLQADQLVPYAKICLTAEIQPQFFARPDIQPLFMQHHRQLIQAVAVRVADDAVFSDIAEQRQFFLDARGKRLAAPADQNIRLDAQRSQFFDAVLGGLGLNLADFVQIGDERNMDKQAIALAQIPFELADGLQKRLGFDIAHRSANLCDDHICPGVLAHGADALLDLVGYMRDHLHSSAKVVSPALFGDDAVVNLAGGDAAIPEAVFIRKALIVADIQIRLRAIVGYEHFAVLEWTHGSRVHIQIGIAFLHCDFVSPALEQPAKGCCRDAFAQRRDDAACNEDVFGCHNCFLRNDKIPFSRAIPPAPDSSGRCACAFCGLPRHN